MWCRPLLIQDKTLMQGSNIIVYNDMKHGKRSRAEDEGFEKKEGRTCSPPCAVHTISD